MDIHLNATANLKSSRMFLDKAGGLLGAFSLGDAE